MASQKIYDYLFQILSEENLSEKVYQQSFDVLAEWVIKTDAFLAHERLVEIIFTAAKSKWYSAAKKVLYNAITNSNNVKIFSQASFKQAFKTISAKEQQFLDSVWELVVEGKSAFEAEIDDPESEFCDEMSDLACELLINFQIVLFQDITKAQKLFEIVFLCIRHASSKIAIRGIECFGELKDTIYDIQKEISGSENSDYLVQAFLDAWKITLEKSKRSLYKLSEDGTMLDEDSEEEETLNSIR